MHLKTKFVPRTVAISLAAMCSMSTHAATTAPGVAPWLSQMGLTGSILSAGNWGTGQVLGIVDTGIVANPAFFARGQVSNSKSACAAVTFRCSSGVADDHGHGTAVAAIAAANATAPFSARWGTYSMAKGDIISVVPNANIVAEKVLNAKGTGTTADVANGIIKAVDAGAAVINLSLTYVPTADIVKAMNYAASKNVITVWAGGNSAMALNRGGNTIGLTKDALSRTIFAGSVGPTNVKSSFSNTPSTGQLKAATGEAVSYANRWVMAPGEGILAPYSPTGTGYGTWTGTSMAAPLVSGSLILLESAWPILKTRGTAANLLLATTTDLGAAGVDATYGSGLVNLGKAFQPYGVLSVGTLKGTTMPVAGITGQMITGGSFGTLEAVRSKLSSYQAFDGYSRNFTVNLSGLIQARPTAATVNPLPTNVNRGVAPMKLADGTELLAWHAPVSGQGDRSDPFGGPAKTAGDVPGRIGYFALTGTTGTTVALGYGVSSQYSLGRAMYDDANLASLVGETNGANFTHLTQDGYHLAYGTPVTGDTHVALAYSQTASKAGRAMPWDSSTVPVTSNLVLGFSGKLSDDLTGGVTFGHLSQQSGLLDLQYEQNSLLSLGATRGRNVGFSLGYSLDANTSLLAEAGFASSDGGTGTGLVGDVTGVRARSFGLTLRSRNLMQPDDSMTIAVKQPMRITSGTIGVQMASVDTDGNPVHQVERASLVPTGREVAVKLGYDLPLRKTQALNLQFGASKDTMNVAGARDANLGAVWTMKF